MEAAAEAESLIQDKRAIEEVTKAVEEGAEVDVEDVTTRSTAGDESLSALQHDIKVKGHNSYYYAHKKKDDWDDSMAWDGNEAPRLLSKGPAGQVASGPAKVESSAAQVVQKTKPVQEVVKTFDKYSWDQQGFKVKVYILLPDVGELPDEAISLVRRPLLNVYDLSPQCCFLCHIHFRNFKSSPLL
jgi:hypothetical protein